MWKRYAIMFLIAVGAVAGAVRPEVKTCVAVLIQLIENIPASQDVSVKE